MRAVKEFTKRRECRVKILFLLPQGRESAQCGRCAPAQARRGGGFGLLAGNEAVVKQDVSVMLQLVSILSLGAGSGPILVVCYVLFCKFPKPLSLQGASSNFLVLRIKAHKTIKVCCALWGPASSGKEGLRKGLLCY